MGKVDNTQEQNGNLSSVMEILRKNRGELSFICQLDWAMGCTDICSNVILGISVRMSCFPVFFITIYVKVFCCFFSVVLRFKLRAYSLSHSTRPFL
jgi:hypothetical protein